MNSAINILGLNILNTTYKEFVAYLDKVIREGEKISFHNVNASILLTSCKDEKFKKNLESFTCLLCDGIGVYRASKFLYGKNGLKERLTGTDLYYHILRLANDNKLKCFFFGGSETAANKLSETLKIEYPGLIISGVIPRETEFKKETIEIIKNSGADILFVGLGSPLQEKWLAENFDLLDIPVQIAIGSGIEFISGAKKRAPLILRKMGLEWVYRIYLEPVRLWKRYFFGIPIFMFKILKLKVKLLDNN